MGLVTLKEILSEAIDNKYAVGAFDTLNPLMTEAILSAAEEERKPLILMQIDSLLEQRKEKEIYFKNMINMIEHTKTPVCLMLDHGASFEHCIRAIHYGFSSVMFDGSMLSLEENIKETKEIVRAAHACGVSVEAEIGHVGGEAINMPLNAEGSSVDKTGFTNPEIAQKFAEETGIDAMAIAFGTVHGKYREKVNLDYERIATIRSMVEIPLVMHGGSGVPEDGFKRAVESGINKINIYTQMIQSSSRAMLKLAKDEEHAGFIDLYNTAEETIKGVVKKHMNIFRTKELSLQKK